MIAPRLDKQEQIQAARATLAAAWIDGERAVATASSAGAVSPQWDPIARAFKDSPAHDWCFTGDTEVLTRHGAYQMMHLKRAGSADVVWLEAVSRRGLKCPTCGGHVQRNHGEMHAGSQNS